LIPLHELPRLPAGYKILPVKTTYLEMRQNPAYGPATAPPGYRVQRWLHPPLKEYRVLFSAVGGAWGWSGRQILDDGELRAILEAPTTMAYRLRCNRKTAGFAELDRRDPARTEIVYFGLCPSFIGRGLGKYFLEQTIRRAWQGGPEIVWLHTCEFDHPAALAVYLKAGFKVAGEKIEAHPYPKDFLGNNGRIAVEK
jgi:GNAT superfamily N-acetyltransferase